MHERSNVNKKLVVQPVFVSLMHIHAFMGPCRYGSGEELTYAYDKKMAEKDLEKFNQDIAAYVDQRYVEILDTRFIEWHEDFAVPDEAVNCQRRRGGLLSDLRYPADFLCFHHHCQAHR